MEKVRIGLIGCGGISRAHVSGYRDLYTRGLKVFEIVAVCDVREAMARERGMEISFFQGTRPRVYTDYRKMLAEEDLEAVDIMVPNYLHHTIVMDCLEYVDVITEKPLAITLRAAKRMIEKAKKENRILAVAENYRRGEESRAIKWAIEKGFIGKPRLVVWMSLYLQPKHMGWFYDKFKAGGSWIFDGGVHIADIDRYHLEREAVEVYALDHTFEPIREGKRMTVSDTTLALIRYEDDILVQWSFSTAMPGRNIHMRVIYGSKGCIEGRRLRIQKGVRIEEVDVVREIMEQIDESRREEWFPRGITNTFAIELYDFYKAVVERREPEVGGREAYKDMAIPLAILESATIGEPVRIRDVEELKIEEYQGVINEKLNIT